jgi:FixJ family two-component response regulator
MLYLNPTVFVVDTDAPAGASLEHVIRQSGLSPKTFATAAEFLAHPPLLSAPSCLVLEVSVFDLDALGVLRCLAAQRPGLPIVVVAAVSNIPMTVLAMKAGAMEFLLTPLADEQLVGAIQNGIARSRAVLVREAGLWELRSRYDSLSGREREVMTHVVAGELNKQVGAALGISEITVKAHRGRVMRKMGAASLPELVMMAMRLDLPIQPVAAPSPAPATGTSRVIAGFAGRSVAMRPLALAR